MLPQFRNRCADFYKKSRNQRFIHILLISLLLRILLMPFFGHIDVLSEARRVYFWAENNIFFDDIARNTTMLIEVLFYKATSFLLPDEFSMFHIDNIKYSTSSIPHSFEFVSHYSIFRTMFVLKLPFLFFDLLTAVVLYNYFDNKENALDSCKMWLFNPITIFAFYVFGRFESIPIFFIAASLLALKRQRFVLAAILLGLCLNGREMMIIYSPLFIVAMFFASFKQIDLPRKLLAITIIFGFTVLALQLYTFVLPEVQNAAGGKAGTIIHEGRVRYLFDFAIDRIMLIPFVYALLLIWLASDNSPMHNKLLLACGLAMMSFFAFSTHTAHFTSWMIIFPAFFYGYNKNLLMPFVGLCVSWFLYWIVLTDPGVFTTWLASAYSLHFIGFPNIPMYIEEFSQNMGIFDRTMLIYLFRSVWVASLLYLAAQMIRITLKKQHEMPS